MMNGRQIKIEFNTFLDKIDSLLKESFVTKDWYYGFDIVNNDVRIKVNVPMKDFDSFNSNVAYEQLKKIKDGGSEQNVI